MAKAPKSIARAFVLYAGLPVSSVIFLTVAWLTLTNVTHYLEKREAVDEGIAEQVLRMRDNPGDRINEIEAIRHERMFPHNRKLAQDIALAAAILIVGAAVPLLVARHVAGMVENNLSLLNERLASGGREGSALMPHTFDFREFDTLVGTLRRVARERGETEQRWKRAEKELVAANADLLSRAEELKEGRKVALSMMEDAENAREELEKVNARLNEAIEHARQSAQEADVANKAKSDFLATMSHEIRTPLNGVIGFIEMLDETELDDEQRDYVDTIRSSGRTLMELINDILDFSKIESGHMNVEVREFNLVRMLRQVVAMFFNDAAGKGLSLELKIDDSVPRRIKGDEVRIRQIITNLLSNSLKFTEKGSIEVFVNAEFSAIEGRRNCEIEFEVRDTGIGMTKAQLRGLFKPFAQGDSSTTRKYGGTGLGLAISKRLAEAMGGRVWATSEEGQGSSFFTRIRIEAQGDDLSDSSPPMPESAEDGAGSGRKPDSAAGNDSKPGDFKPLSIMVAEDNHANQRVLMIMLRRLGWEADFFENGEELVEALKARACDLIFMDLQMPVLDGIGAARKIRRGEAGEAVKQVKIVALTANALSEDARRCKEAGMERYLTKPIKIDKLKATIEELFPIPTQADG